TRSSTSCVRRPTRSAPIDCLTSSAVSPSPPSTPNTHCISSPGPAMKPSRLIIVCQITFPLTVRLALLSSAVRAGTSRCEASTDTEQPGSGHCDRGPGLEHRLEARDHHRPAAADTLEHRAAGLEPVVHDREFDEVVRPLEHEGDFRSRL